MFRVAWRASIVLVAFNVGLLLIDQRHGREHFVALVLSVVIPAIGAFVGVRFPRGLGHG